MNCRYHSKTCTGVVTSLLEMLVAITQGASAAFAKRQKFPQIAGVSASKFPAQCFYSQLQPGSRFGTVIKFAVGWSRAPTTSILLT